MTILKLRMLEKMELMKTFGHKRDEIISAFRRPHRAEVYLFILRTKYQFFFVKWRCCPTRAVPPSFLRFLDAPQSVGLPWTSDRLVAETSAIQHTTLNNRHTFMSSNGIRTRNPSKRDAADLSCYWDRHQIALGLNKIRDYEKHIQIFNGET